MRLDSVDQDLPFAIGSEIQARYRLLEVIGRGGMGTVYKAHDARMRRDVALKALSPELVAHSQARRRMHREAKALTGIEHDNVVRIFDYFDEGAIFVIVLELVSGGTLGSLVGRIDADRAVQLMLDVLRGLEAIHASPDGLVHRDIKPDNILITAAGRAKVTDFSVARDESSHDRTKVGVQIGTVPYMSPEQTQGLPVDMRSDLFSASIVFFELLSGKKPFEGPSELEVGRRIVHEPPDWEQIRGRAPDPVCSVVARGLAKDPQARFSSAAEMREALERAAQGHFPAPSSQVLSVPPRAPVPRSAPTGGELDFSGRLGRLGFLGRTVLSATAVVCIVGVGLVVGEVSELIGGLVMLVALLPFLWSLAITSRRLHDFGWSGWTQVLYYAFWLGNLALDEPAPVFEGVVSIAWMLVLLVRPGSPHTNAYGSPA
jgi:serine/threonine protein kinase